MSGFDEQGLSETVSYEPTSVKDLLVEMKDTAELLIDLSYSAVLHASPSVAREVVELEHRMDVLQMRARMSLMLAARSPNEAETLAPVLGVVAAADKVSDAAGDIAKIVGDQIGLPDAMRGALTEGVETLVRGTVAADSPYAARTLADIDLESVTGVRAIAVRRDDEWILNPGAKTRLEPGDVTLLRGPETGVSEAYPALTGDPFEPEPVVEPAIDDLERAVDSIVLMKNLSELAVDLAYGAVLFDNDELAAEVSNLEVEVDALHSRFEAWTLRAAKAAADPVSLRGLIHLGVATEEISDAALEIAEGVLRDLSVHPVVEMAVRESDEIITRTSVSAGSNLAGTTITDGVPATDIATSVLAIRRPDEGWLVGPDLDTTVEANDVIISKGTRTSAAEFAALANA